MIRKPVLTALILISFLIASFGVCFAQEKATPQEVYNMVLKAAQMIEQLGEEGLNALSDTKEFVWKDSYVWAVNCEEKKLVAHPNKKLIGLDLSKIYDKNPDKSKRKLHNLEMCAGASKPNGVWVEYYWEKLGETEASRKIGFMIQVPDNPIRLPPAFTTTPPLSRT
jgi:cytochrome c